MNLLATQPPAVSRPASLAPVPLPFTPERQEEVLAILRYLTAMVEALPVRRSCQLCDQFQPEAWCNVWGDQVPENAQPVGCDRWVPLLPF